MTEPIRIDIGICTFRRTHIVETLRSIATLTLPENTTIHIIVADNDDTSSARERVENTARECALSLTYLHAPARNISIARNACLSASTAPYLAFIDDDELVTPSWLSALLHTQQESHAEVVLGPVKAIYDAHCPAWIQKGDFHSTMPVWMKQGIITGYSCNVLIKRIDPNLQGLRFRIDLGKSGGEDTIYFSEIYKAGGRFAFADSAVVTEQVTNDRARISWLLKRRFRSGQTHGLLLLGFPGSKCKKLALTFLKMGYCLLCTIPNVTKTDRMMFWLLRAGFHAGVISCLLGVDTVEIYGENS